MFDNFKLNYKQKANLSDTELPGPRAIVALQKIHKGKLKLTIIKVQLKRNETERIQSHAYRLSSLCAWEQLELDVVKFAE